MSKPLTDIDPMPFGIHKGKPMQDVPVDYLHYLWTKGMKRESSPVANYIRENIEALRLENDDLIWS